MIKEKKMISQFIFESRHQGTVNALWFEDDKAEREFINFLEYARDLPLTTVRTGPGMSSESTTSLFTYLSDKEINAENVKGTLMERINAGAEVLVLKNPDSSDAFYELILSLKHHKRPSIFLVDERVSTSFISDKIICVDREGGNNGCFFSGHG